MKKDADLSWLKSLTMLPGLRSEDYEFSGDREALSAFKSIPGATILCSKWIEFWLEFRKTGFLGSTIKVSEKQFPEVNTLRLKAAEALGLAPPPLFIVEQPMINAFTMGTDDTTSFVAITRPLLEAVTEKELMFILGHEFGHIKSQHSLYATIAIFLANMGLFYGYRFLPVHLLVYPLEIALKAWFRRSEITCDRAGLLCAQDLDAGRRALLLLGCCSRELADRIDLDEFRKQSEEVSKSYGKWSELFLTHPYLPKRIRCLELFAESHLYIRRVLQDKKSKFLDDEDMDRATGQILGNEKPVVEKVKENGDEARLNVAMAFAGAWADGRMSQKKREALEELIGSAKLAAAEQKSLREFLEKAFPPELAMREMKYFSGDKLQALPYAYSYLLLDTEGVDHRQARFLMDLSQASGVGLDQAENLVFDVGARKRFFQEFCGTDFCARCGRLFGRGLDACPRCDTQAGSLRQPETMQIKRLSEKLDELRKSAGRVAMGAGSEFLRVLAKGLKASADFLESKPAAEPKAGPRRRRKPK